MSFQAYLDAVKAKTGLDPEGVLALTKERGVYTPDLKATDLINRLTAEFDLGARSLNVHLGGIQGQGLGERRLMPKRLCCSDYRQKCHNDQDDFTKLILICIFETAAS